MPINLSKGQKVDLTKGNPGLKNIMVGLGWDMPDREGIYLLRKLRTRQRCGKTYGRQSDRGRGRRR